MRSDIKILLDKLGKNQFRYKEFADRFSDLDTWPIFESVIRDPRVLNSELNGGSSLEQPHTSGVVSMAPLFSEKYGAQDGDRVTKSAGRSGTDVRTLLTQIASAVEKGAI